MTKINEEQELFYSQFEALVKDKIISTELAELRTGEPVLKALDLKPYPGHYSLWGLIVFCEHGIYFYVPPRENTVMGFIVRKKAGDEDKAQILDLGRLKEFSAVKARTGFFGFLNPEKSRTLNCSCRISGENEDCTVFFDFICGNKAEAVAEKFKQ